MPIAFIQGRRNGQLCALPDEPGNASRIALENARVCPLDTRKTKRRLPYPGEYRIAAVLSRDSLLQVAKPVRTRQSALTR
jgi:hypothetical protein